jgi:hypothetical protein
MISFQNVPSITRLAAGDFRDDALQTELAHGVKHSVVMSLAVFDVLNAADRTIVTASNGRMIPLK